MARMFKKILCPVAFNDNSIAALDYARALALESGAMLYVMNVVFLPLETLEPRPAVSEEPSRLALEKLARERFHDKVRYKLVVGIG